MTPLVFHKCIVLFSVLFTTLLSGISPWFMVRFFRKQRGNYNMSQKNKIKSIFSCLNMFSGGVFLGVCFMHLMPEVKQQMTYCISKLNYAKDFPATEFLVVIGFFLVVITEIIVSQYLMKKHAKGKHSSEGQGKYKTLNEKIYSGEDSMAANGSPQDIRKYGAISNGCADSEKIERNGTKSINATSDSVTSTGSIESSSECDTEHNHLPISTGEETVVRSVLLFLALSLHTIFDGLSLGLQDDVSQLYSLFTAVMIHKILIGFTLGLQIFEYSLWTIGRSILLMVIFACISPIGMVIGIMIGRIQGHELARAVTSAILNGLATGTFLYVTFIEILGRELAQKGSVIKVFFAITGFALMTGLVFFE